MHAVCTREESVRVPLLNTYIARLCPQCPMREMEILGFQQLAGNPTPSGTWGGSTVQNS